MKKSSHTNVERAAIQWWRSRRPQAFNLREHLANPTVNTIGSSERELAKAVANLLAAPAGKGKIIS